MAAVGNIIVRGIYTGDEQPQAVVIVDGEEEPIILPNVTHLTVHDSFFVVRRAAFRFHPNIIELDCHNDVRTIGVEAFVECPSLERLLIPGVEEVERMAFFGCAAVQRVGCAKLEIIGGFAFMRCVSLSSIDLPSAKRVEIGSFAYCGVMRFAKFGESLDRLEALALCYCRALDRITIPLKNGLIGHDNVFAGCHRLNRVDLVEATILQETKAALLMAEWRQDMGNVIGSINHILPNTPAGSSASDVGGKARAIREWIGNVLRKIIHYKAEHRRFLKEAATAVQLHLPNDIVHNNVLAFLELPSHTFDGENNDSMPKTKLAWTSAGPNAGENLAPSPAPPPTDATAVCQMTAAMSLALLAVAPKLKTGITRSERMYLEYKEWLSQKLFGGDSGEKRALKLYLGKDPNYTYAEICQILESGGTIVMKLMFLAEYPYYRGAFLLTNETEESANNGVMLQEGGGLEATAKWKEWW